MAKIDEDFARLTAKLASAEAVEDKAAALIAELLQELRDARKQPDIGAAVDTLIAKIDQHQQPLASAVAAGDFQPSGQ